MDEREASEIPTDDQQPGLGFHDGDDDDGPDGDPLLLRQKQPVKPRPKRVVKTKRRKAE